MTRNDLLQKISALDFFVIDLSLYLNTHPNDGEAIKLYNDAVTQVNALREEFTRTYGMMLANSSTSRQPWQWIDDPWPWEKSFNFEIKEEMG